MFKKDRIYSFRELEVYKNSYSACVTVMSGILPKLPSSEKYDLVDQLSRSCKAIPRLIAEGYAKRHQKFGFQKYIDDAMAECNETIVGLEQVKDVYHIETTLCEELIDMYDKTARQLFKLALAWDSFKNRRKSTPLDDTGRDTETQRRFSGQQSNRRGFTLVEVMIVVSLLVVFLGFGATSGNAIRNQLAFFRDQQVLIASIYKARAQAIATLNKETGVCGYGVDVQPTGASEGSIVRVLKFIGDAGNCIEDEEETKQLEVTEATAVGADQVVFIAPIPTAEFRPSGSGICFQLSAPGSITGGVRVNQFGQVTAVAACN